MTNKDAIAILTDCLDKADYKYGAYGIALKMAIKALEQEPIFEKVNKMKSEIADSLEFWDYSPNNNPLARDMLETLTNFWGDIRGEEV